MLQQAITAPRTVEHYMKALKQCMIFLAKQEQNCLTDISTGEHIKKQ